MKMQCGSQNFEPSILRRKKKLNKSLDNDLPKKLKA